MYGRSPRRLRGKEREREKRVSHTHKRLHAYIKTNPKKSIKTTRDRRVVFCFYLSSTLSSFNSVVRIFSRTTRTTFPLRRRLRRYYKTTRRAHAKEVCALLLMLCVCVCVFCCVLINHFPGPVTRVPWGGEHSAQEAFAVWTSCSAHGRHHTRSRYVRCDEGGDFFFKVPSAYLYHPYIDDYRLSPNRRDIISDSPAFYNKTIVFVVKLAV